MGINEEFSFRQKPVLIYLTEEQNQFIWCRFRTKNAYFCHLHGVFRSSEVYDFKIR